MTVPLPAALPHLPDRPTGIVCGALRTPLHTDKNLNAPGVSDKGSLALSATGSPLVRQERTLEAVQETAHSTSSPGDLRPASWSLRASIPLKNRRVRAVAVSQVPG